MISPFSRRFSKLPPSDTRSLLRLEFSDLTIPIVDRDFFGSYSESPNGEYVLVWCDADTRSYCGGHRSYRGGHRYSGKGDYLLIHDDRIIAEGRMERPHDGKVSNCGRFALSDWHFGNGLKSTFYVFDSQGKILISKKFKANAFNSGISPDGRFAIFLTARSDNDDSNKISLFDVDSATVLWSKEPKSGRPDRYEFDTVEALLWLVYEGKGRYSFSMTDGTFLDLDRWEKERVGWANPVELSRIGQERLKAAGSDLDFKTGAEITFILSKAIELGVDENPFEYSMTLRALGDVWAHLGDSREALQRFKEAQSINPKISVKRRIDRVSRDIEKLV